GGSMMVPVGRLIVLRTTPKAGLVAALAWLTVPALVGPVMGPPLGGFITTYFDWRWIFWINIPIAVLGLILATIYIPKITTEAVRAFDFLGFLLVGPGLAAFLTGVTMAGLGMASGTVMTGLTVGGMALVIAYVFHALRVEAPLVDLRLLHWPTFRIAAAGGMFFRVGGGATPFLLPLLFQLGFGLTPFQSGMMTFASGVGAITMKFLAQPLLMRFGFRRILIWNAVISCCFVALPATFTASTPYLVMVGTLFLGGTCRSLQFTSINAMAYADVPSERLSSATSFNAVLQQLSSSIGITIAAFGLQTVQDYTGLQQIVTATFPPVFLLMATVSVISTFWWLKLTPESGGSLLERAPAKG
ncbi:MAG: MFS transporter, partial [Paracoccaceae bacterium]|nr:MFS transporter [Paracoccaceae bacterium]